LDGVFLLVGLNVKGGAPRGRNEPECPARIRTRLLAVDASGINTLSSWKHAPSQYRAPRFRNRFVLRPIKPPGSRSRVCMPGASKWRAAVLRSRIRITPVVTRCSAALVFKTSCSYQPPKKPPSEAWVVRQSTPAIPANSHRTLEPVLRKGTREETLAASWCSVLALGLGAFGPPLYYIP
jgi:hypothetical protein